MRSTKPGWLTAHLPKRLPERSERPVKRWCCGGSINRAWREIPVELITRSFKSCGISSAVDGTEDDAVWDDEEEEAEDTEERIDKEFETDSEAEDDE